MDIPSDAVRPAPFKGGDIGEYTTEILSNGGFGTRHEPTDHVLPHVRSDLPEEQLSQEIPNANGPGGLMSPGKAAQAVQGLQIANLGVGLLNLGINAWTAWKTYQMDGKLDEVLERSDRIESKVDGLSAFLSDSVEHLDRLVRQNAAMLGLLAEGQSSIENSIEQLRSEVKEGVQSIEETLASKEEREKARKLEERMRTLFQYYQSCSRTMEGGEEPSSTDVRHIVDRATEAIATLHTQIQELPRKSSERLPLYVAWAYALNLETEARLVLDENFGAQKEKKEKLLKELNQELRTLVQNPSLYELACKRRELVEQYIYLHRGVRGAVTSITLPSGRVKSFYPERSVDWEDGLDPLEELLNQSSTSSPPSSIELRSLKEHDSWETLAGLPTGESREEVRYSDFADAIGIPDTDFVSREGAREILHVGPEALSHTREKVEKEIR